MVRRKLSRMWQDIIGNGKEALRDRSEEDMSIQEATEIFRRVPPSVTLNAFPINSEGDQEVFSGSRVGPIQATGDETAEYLEEAEKTADEIIKEEFTVPHYEKRRGHKKLPVNNSWGSQTVPTGDTRFKYEAEIVLPHTSKTFYDDKIPEGRYKVKISSNQMDDDEIDAVLGNIESQTQTVRVSQNNLLDYLQGLDGEVNAEDMNADSMAQKASRSSNFEVLTDDIVKGGDGDDLYDFIQANHDQNYSNIWSGVIYETDSGQTGIWHLATPGSNDLVEGYRPVISGELDIGYSQSLNQLN